MGERFNFIPKSETLHKYSPAGLVAGAVLTVINPLVGISVMAASAGAYLLTEGKSNKTPA